jgi:hypothetical protein
MSCPRCKKPTVATIMSIFNTDLICLECKCAEQKHPLYDQAMEAAQEAFRDGNYKFPGIGYMPCDRQPRKPKNRAQSHDLF